MYPQRACPGHLTAFAVADDYEDQDFPEEKKAVWALRFPFFTMSPFLTVGVFLLMVGVVSLGFVFAILWHFLLALALCLWMGLKRIRGWNLAAVIGGGINGAFGRR